MNVKYCIVFVAAVLFAALTMPTTAATVTFTGHVVADFVGPGVFSQVDTTDQNITDPRFNTNPPGCMDAPMGEVCFLVPPAKFSPSGFNVQAVYWTYDCATDCLYIGLRLPDERIAWDSNDDDNILTSIQAPPAILQQQFSDTDYEEYVLFFGVDQTNPNTFTETFKITIADMNGGIDPQISVTKGGLPYAGVTATWFKGPRTPPNYPGTEKDIEVKVCGIRAAYPGGGPGKPCVLTTRSGGPGDLTDEDTTEQVISLTCDACISVTKQVACSPNGPWVPLVEVPVSFDSSSDAVQANAHGLLNGDQVKFDSIITTTGINTSTLYYVVNANANSFQISLTKGGTPVDLINNGTGTYHKVSHVDILAGNPVYFKLDVTNCGSENLINVTVTDTGCSGGATDCGNIVIGNLASGETKSQTCSYASIAADCINTATATGSGEFTGTTVTAVDFATVSVLTPSIICTTLVDDNPNFTHNSSTLDLPCGSDIAQVYYRLCITNNGQVPIDFGTIGPCGITDSLLDNAFTGISGLPANVCALFRAQPQLATGILAPGATVCVTVGPLGFDKCTLCKNDATSLTNDFKATGLANLGDCGSTLVSTDTCTTTVNVCCQPDIQITKQVACATETSDCAQGDYQDSVNALPGGYVCFKIVVTNTGCDDLENVVITDSITDQNSALLPCSSCCTGANTIPGTINVGNLAIGASQTYYCKFRTNPAFSTTGTSVDATNTASVSGTGVSSGLPASAGPVSATVNILIPSITCASLVSASADFTNATTTLDLPCEGDNVAPVYYRLCITNNGETPVDFGTTGPCGITNSLLDTTLAGISGLPVDVCALFRAQPQLATGSLAVGATVCAVVGPINFDKCALCKNETRTITNDFVASGAPKGEGICPETLIVTTGTCTTTVNVCCRPDLTITKEVACSTLEADCANGVYGSSTTALRGAYVCFKLTVTNTGCDDLKDVVITDTLTDDNGALLPCEQCCTGNQTIPGSIPVGNLAVGASQTFYCKVQTNPVFSIFGTAVDATNTASAVGVGVTSGITANAGPSSATVNVLVPRIECSKLVNDSTDFTNATNFLDLGGPTCTAGIKTVYYKLCINNTGDIAVDFTKGDCAEHFADSLLDNLPTGITLVSTTPATNPVSISQAFLNQLTNGTLPAGGSVCVVVATSYDEEELCKTQSTYDNIFTACGLATDANVCLPADRGEQVLTEGCSATVEICCPCRLEITKLVSCSADGPFTENVQAVAGSDVYFKICVKNIGSMNIDNITVTDTLPPSAAFDSCVECKVNGTPVPCFINSGSWNVGSLAIGAEACVICKVKTKADFSVIGQIDDIVNSASASGVCALGSTITAGPAVATVDLLVASIACEKWVDVDEAMTNPVKILDAGDPMHPQTNAFFQTCVINTGEVDIDFTGAGTTPCPSFIDPKIATPNALIPGTGVDVNAAMLAELQALNGSAVLKPGQRVCHVFGPLLFDQAVLCPAGISNWLNEFSACGMARQDGVCGEKTVTTGTCDALVVICPPTLKQVFCGLTCDTTNSVQKGFAGIGPDTITAVPGVFAINPGDSQWSNWVKAAGEQVPYTLTKVTLRKHMDQSTDCPDVFPGEDVIQIWPKMQLWWPLMYEIPGTTFVITVYYDTLSPWDEGGTKPPTISHAEAFSFRVDASLPDLKKLLALFHQLPLGSHQVPVISDEALYLKMQADLDEIIGLIEQGNTSFAGEKLLDFQLLVENHCIEIFAPTKPLVGGAGTGIANTCENPACCKILADVTWIQNELGLLHP